MPCSWYVSQRLSCPMIDNCKGAKHLQANLSYNSLVDVTCSLKFQFPYSRISSYKIISSTKPKILRNLSSYMASTHVILYQSFNFPTSLEEFQHGGTVGSPDVIDIFSKNHTLSGFCDHCRDRSPGLRFSFPDHKRVVRLPLSWLFFTENSVDQPVP